MAPPRTDENRAQPLPAAPPAPSSPSHEPADFYIPAGHAAPPSSPEAPGHARPHEPADFYINVFQDNRRHWMNAEAAFTELSDCYESILDGQRGCAYCYTLHVRRLADGTRAVLLGDFEPDARAWAAEPDTQESFLYARSAGRRL